jgi:hypothetical protein
MSTYIGLEIWLTGTPAELDAAARALAPLGRIAWRSDRQWLTGTDAGRCRVYVRIYLATAPAARPASGQKPASAAPTPLDLAA